MNVTSVFKPAGEDVQLLVAHSTEDKLGGAIVERLKTNLNQDVRVVAEERIASFAEWGQMMKKNYQFNVFLVIAHGDELTNATWLYNDKDVAGHELSVNTGELLVTLNGYVENKLCLFGVCYSGTDDLATAIHKRALASACIAPKPNSTITGSEIADGYGSLLNRLQEMSSSDVGWEGLHSGLVRAIPEPLVKKLSIVPA